MRSWNKMFARNIANNVKFNCQAMSSSRPLPPCKGLGNLADAIASAKGSTKIRGPFKIACPAGCGKYIWPAERPMHDKYDCRPPKVHTAKSNASLVAKYVIAPRKSKKKPSAKLGHKKEQRITVEQARVRLLAEAVASNSKSFLRISGRAKIRKS